MTEEEAQVILREGFGVSRETFAKMDHFREIVLAESERQNLISASSAAHFWVRHILDSAQLVPMAGEAIHAAKPWIDLGTGAGFPGMIVAMMVPCPIILVESRRKRFEFLRESAQKLGLAHVHVHGGRLETLDSTAASVISARAFAPLDTLLPLAHRFSTAETQWLLPKGKSAQAELESVRGTWQGSFHVKQSMTDPEAAILYAEGVKRKRSR